MPGNNPWVFTENKYMKNLILKWLGLDNMLDLGDVEICVEGLLRSRYDLEGLVSKFDDYVGTVDDLEYKSDRWSDMADKIEDLDVEEVAYQHHINGLKDKLDKIQELDDRLTELLAGYKLDVQLMKEDF